MASGPVTRAWWQSFKYSSAIHSLEVILRPRAGATKQEHFALAASRSSRQPLVHPRSRLPA